MLHRLEMNRARVEVSAIAVAVLCWLTSARAAEDPCSLKENTESCRKLDENLKQLKPPGSTAAEGHQAKDLTPKKGQKRTSADLKEGTQLKSGEVGKRSEPVKKDCKPSKREVSSEPTGVTEHDLERLKTAATEASRLYSRIAKACEPKRCDPMPKRKALLEALVWYARGLAAGHALADATLQQKLEAEQLRLFSGSAISGTALAEAVQNCVASGGCSIAELGEAIKSAAEAAAKHKVAPTELEDGMAAYLDGGGDPKQFGATLSRLAEALGTNQGAAGGLGEVMSLYQSLHQPGARHAFAEQLRALRASLTPRESALADKLEANPNDIELMNLLLEAQKALITLGLGVTKHFGYQPGQGEAGAKWLELVFVYPKDHSISQAKDFEEALEALLEAMTTDGIPQPSTADLCAQKANPQARGFLVIRFAAAGERLAVSGEFYLKNQAFLDACDAKGPPRPAEQFGTEMASGCPGAADPTGSAPDCARDQVAAANRLMKGFAEKHPIFRRLKYLQAGQSIEQIGPILPSGVTFSDVHEKAALTAPGVLATAPGLYLDGHCTPSFESGLRSRLRSSYTGDIGPLVEAGAPGGPVPKLRLKSEGTSCRAALVVEDQDVYGIRASSSAEKMQDAGDGVARVVGQYYRDVRSSQVQAVSRWTALAFSGLPYLLDANGTNDRTGWFLAALDISLLACGVGTGAATIAARNDYAARPIGDLGTANGFLIASMACFGTWAAQRFLAAALYQ